MAITPLPHPTPAGVVAAACAELGAATGSLWSARLGWLVAGGGCSGSRLWQRRWRPVCWRFEVETARRGWAGGRRPLVQPPGGHHAAAGPACRGARRVVDLRGAVSRCALCATQWFSPDQAGVIVDAVDRLPLAEQSRPRRAGADRGGRAAQTPPTCTGRFAIWSGWSTDGDQRCRRAGAGPRGAWWSTSTGLPERQRRRLRRDPVHGPGSVEDGATLRAEPVKFSV